jgi:hypothetical protein
VSSSLLPPPFRKLLIIVLPDEALLLQAQISNVDGPSSQLLGIVGDYFNNLASNINGKALKIINEEHRYDLAALCPPLEYDPPSYEAIGRGAVIHARTHATIRNTSSTRTSDGL